jgi:hypothetical protein
MSENNPWDNVPQNGDLLSELPISGPALLEELDIERFELSRKSELLKLFIIKDPLYKTIKEEQRDLLDLQLSIMIDYENVLINRMKLLNLENK